jgi:hypothetical protein
MRSLKREQKRENKEKVHKVKLQNEKGEKKSILKTPIISFFFCFPPKRKENLAVVIAMFRRLFPRFTANMLNAFRFTLPYICRLRLTLQIKIPFLPAVCRVKTQNGNFHLYFFFSFVRWHLWKGVNECTFSRPQIFPSRRRRKKRRLRDEKK